MQRHWGGITEEEEEDVGTRLRMWLPGTRETHHMVGSQIRGIRKYPENIYYRQRLNVENTVTLGSSPVHLTLQTPRGRNL